MKTKIIYSALAAILLLASCAPAATPEPMPPTVDIGAVQTAAVQTVVAAVTQTVAAFTPTTAPTNTTEPTAAPTNAPTPSGTATPVICNSMNFISDVTITDGTELAPGQEFVKTWKVKNTASCTWTRGYTIIHAYGEKMGGQTTALTEEVLPGAEADISINLKAPTQPGTYSGYWRLSSNNGENFGTMLTVVIVVK
jgi:hypothetical protein